MKGACTDNGTRAPQVHPRGAGIANSFEMVLRFLVWAQEQRNLTAESIAAHWGVSRATSYRWLGAYCAAKGIPVPASPTVWTPERRKKLSESLKRSWARRRAAA